MDRYNCGIPRTIASIEWYISHLGIQFSLTIARIHLRIAKEHCETALLH